MLKITGEKHTKFGAD